eukprot:2749267-Pleurochrysis_carterae.AAC.3
MQACKDKSLLDTFMVELTLTSLASVDSEPEALRRHQMLANGGDARRRPLYLLTVCLLRLPVDPHIRPPSQTCSFLLLSCYVHPPYCSVLFCSPTCVVLSLLPASDLHLATCCFDMFMFIHSSLRPPPLSLLSLTLPLHLYPSLSLDLSPSFYTPLTFVKRSTASRVWHLLISIANRQRLVLLRLSRRCVSPRNVSVEDDEEVESDTDGEEVGEQSAATTAAQR